MKLRIVFSLVALLLVVFSCSKKDFKDKDKNDVLTCTLADSKQATNSDYQDPDNLPSNVTKYILKELKYNATTGCITEGSVKYLKDGITVALVNYGYGEAGKSAIITNCVNGDCGDVLAHCTKFEQTCN